MSDRIGAPGTGLSRREFIAATGGVGTAAIAGCVAPGQQSGSQSPRASIESPSELPSTSAPEVVQVDEQGGSVTLRSVTSSHAVHPLDSMGGPVELPQVWAFQADDGEPSVPGPILRTTEGNDMEVTLDNTGNTHPHTLHFHGARKTWENDGVPTTTGIRVDPGEKHTYTIPANVPGTHLYHCHYQTQRHIDMGMYGIFRVDPKGYEPADKEYFEADADPGIYPMHCHKVDHAMNGNSYPGGMVSAIVYRDVMDTDIFANLMDYAGYEG